MLRLHVIPLSSLHFSPSLTLFLRQSSFPNYSRPQTPTPKRLHTSVTASDSTGLGPIRQLLVLPQEKPRGQGDAAWRLYQGFRITLIGSVQATQDEMPKSAYYAVAVGTKSGVYPTWAECEAQVKGVKGAKYKKFNTRPQAEAYIKDAGRGTTTPTPYSGIQIDDGHERIRQKGVFAGEPLTAADPSTLPPELQSASRAGFSFTPPPHRLIVYTDGSSLSNGTKQARAGLGVWWGHTGQAKECNLGERVPGPVQTNNVGELLSVVRALETCPYPDLPLEIRTDSQYVIGCMTTYLPKWLKTNFRLTSKGGPVKNVEIIKHLLVLLRRRGPGQAVRFKHIKGHAGHEGNEMADELARSGARKWEVPARTDWLDLESIDDDERIIVGSRSDIEVDVDESWLMTGEELEALEQHCEK